MRASSIHSWVVLISFGWMLPDSPALPQNSDRDYEIYHIQAAFIYNFIDYVTWPESVPRRQHFRIGILGLDPFEDAFVPIEGTQVRGQTIQIHKSDRFADLQDCHILFISSSEARRLPAILQELGKTPALTVSDMDRFAKMGGMIQFYVTDVGGELKVRFDINKERVDASGLRMSFKLLSLARAKQ